MKELYKLKDMLCDELKEQAGKGKLDMPTLELVDKLAHSCKNVCKIIEACEAEQGYSNGSYSMPYMPMSYSYEGGASYARGRGPNAARDSMGRYSSEGYSRHGDFRMEFQNLLNEAPNERIRQKMIECMNEM